MFRTVFIAVLGFVAVMIAANYAGPSLRLYAVGLVVALFGIWTVSELNAYKRVHWIVSLIVLAGYGALSGLVAGWVIG